MSIIKASSLEKADFIRTNTMFDRLSGIGGIPLGRITEVWGDDGVGKSTICLQSVANAQKDGDIKVLWADSEWSYDSLYAKALGVDNSRVDVLREQVGETLLSQIEEAAEGGKYKLIVLDSIGGLTPRAELEKDMEGKTIGGQAGLMAKFCRKIVPVLSIKNVALLVINHSFVDIMSGRLMTSGGRKLLYHRSLSVRLKVNTKVVIKQGDRKVGKVVIGIVAKNKVAPTEGMEVEGQLIFGTGFSKAADLLGEAIDRKIITKEGQSYFFNGTKLARGLEATRKFLEENAELLEQVTVALSNPQTA